MNTDIRKIFKLYESFYGERYIIKRPEGDWEYFPQWITNEEDSYWWHLVVPPESISDSVWACDISGRENPDLEMIRKWLILRRPDRKTYGTIGPLTKELIDSKYRKYESLLKDNETGLDLTF